MGNFWGKIYVQGQDVRSRAMHYHSQPQPAQPKASPKTFENGRLCKEGRPAAPNLLQSSSGCGPTVQLCPVSDWFPRARMGLTLSSVFGRLFGKKQMRILMGESGWQCLLEMCPWHTFGFPPLFEIHKWWCGVNTDILSRWLCHHRRLCQSSETLFYGFKSLSCCISVLCTMLLACVLCRTDLCFNKCLKSTDFSWTWCCWKDHDSLQA